jgi:ATP-dependent helicase HrpB
MFDLPVETILEKLSATLQKNICAVLQAPPGAGKTTRVPLALLDEKWLVGKRILMLEPRRLATRAAAMRMAASLGEPVGETVGYRMRMESRVGPQTRIEVLTEGVLTRMLQRDPSLAGVGLVIFDEFHERSLAADLALALCLEIQGVLNERLRLLAMSATLDSEALSKIMNQAPVIFCEGRQFPVETVYVGAGSATTLAQNVAVTICRTVNHYPGSLLVFLPGAPEIRKVQGLLEKSNLGRDCLVAPLYGNLTRSKQQQAIEPAPEKRRKIVLATDIAETSLTIEGIGVVIDGGFRRAPSYDVASGMTRLVTLPVSRASADQRRGRAGRLGPGVCLRMWDQHRQNSLAPHNRPEILETDLTALVLELMVWGANDVHQLKWIDPPPQAALKKATYLLGELKAITFEASGIVRATRHGRQMAELGLHPRLAHMLLMAREVGQGVLACRLAAILGERDFIRFKPGAYDADLRLRLDVLKAFKVGRNFGGAELDIDTGACRRILKTAGLFEKRLKIDRSKPCLSGAGRLLAWAYPDRIAKQRAGNNCRYLMVNGRGAYFSEAEPLSAKTYLVAAALDGDKREARIFLAAGFDQVDLEDQFGERIKESVKVVWDSGKKTVSAVRRRTIGALNVSQVRFDGAPPEQVLAAMLTGIRQQGLECLPWTKSLKSWQMRVSFLRRLYSDDAGWPDVSDNHLIDTLETWLAPYLDGITSLKRLGGIDLKNALQGLLGWRHQGLLNELAPTHLQAPSGARIPIDYNSDPPVVAVRIQQMFGATKTPAVAGGRQPLLLHLLSPAGRPMQITADLAGFWTNSYHMVKKDLKARYPKHHWPDDPLKATPTDRAKPRALKK